MILMISWGTGDNPPTFLWALVWRHSLPRGSIVINYNQLALVTSLISTSDIQMVLMTQTLEDQCIPLQFSVCLETAMDILAFNLGIELPTPIV